MRLRIVIVSAVVGVICVALWFWLHRPLEQPACSNEPCRVPCERGEQLSCVGLAIALEENPETRLEAAKLYQKACDAGVRLGCARLDRRRELEEAKSKLLGP